MTTFLSKAADRVRRTGLVVPLFGVFVVLTVIGLGLLTEDVIDSWYGYILLPTLKSGEWVAYLVALLPSIGQIAFAYVFLDSGGKKGWAGLVFLALHISDVYTDMVYKTSQQGTWDVWVIAFIESEVLFTVGSELATMTGFGMVLELWPDIRQRLPRLNIRGAIMRLAGADDDEEDAAPGASRGRSTY